MARDQKSELHLPLAIHRAVARLMVKVWDQVESELSHRSHRKSKLGEKQPTVPPGRGVRTVFSELSRESRGLVQGGPQALHRLPPTGCAQD